MKYSLLVLAAVLLVGCSAKQAGAGPSQTEPSSVVVTPAPASLTSRPPVSTVPLVGRLNPAVTQSTIGTTICVQGWTAKIRPTLSTRSGQEHDHIVPLELGGAPKDPGNLWFEPLAAARKADIEETRLHREVCAGKISLSEAQWEIVKWKRERG